MPFVKTESGVRLFVQTDDNPEGVPKELLDGFVRKIDDDRPAFLQEFGKIFFGQGLIKKPVSQALLDWNQSLALQGDHKATTDLIPTFSQTDFRGELAKIRVPTLVIHGDADKVVPFEATGKAAGAQILNAQLKIYEGAPHGLFYTEKDRLNADLLAFIQ